jgi:hypothetical protein
MAALSSLTEHSKSEVGQNGSCSSRTPIKAEMLTESFRVLSSTPYSLFVTLAFIPSHNTLPVFMPSREAQLA